MAPKFTESSFTFAADDTVPEHEDRYVMAEERDPSKWWVRGHDTFAGEDYTLAIDIEDAETAHALANAARRHIEEAQPTATSGGQSYWGIQDRVDVMPPEDLPPITNN